MEQPNFIDLTDYNDIKEKFPFPDGTNNVDPNDFGSELENDTEESEDFRKAA
jgi:hypothetical protein